MPASGSATRPVNVDDNNTNKRRKTGKVDPSEIQEHHEELRDSLVDTFSTITQRGVDLSELADLVQGAVNDAFIIHDHNTKHNGGKTDKS